MSEERVMILKMVQENRISVEEAERLLAALDSGPKAGQQSGASQSAGQGGSGSVFDKARPQVEQMIGGFSSLIEQVSHSVSSQLGPNLEKRFENWFQQRGFKDAKGEGFEVSRRDEDVVPVEGSQQLRCFHRLGDLLVEGYDGSQIQAVLEKQIITQKVEDKLRFEDLRLTHRVEGSTLHLELAGADGLRPADGRVRLLLKVPVSLDLDLRTESGNITLGQISRTAGTAHLESESGDIELRNVALKRLELNSRSGDVLADQASESIQIQTASGDIKLKGSVYEGKVSTQSGNVRVDASVAQVLKLESRSSDLNVQLLDGRGRLDLRSNSGDIELTGQIRSEAELTTQSGDLHCDLTLAEGGTASLNSQSGDVDLILRPGSACRVDAEAVSGDIECRLELAQREQSEHGLRGRLGEGGGELRVRTTSGDVLIS